MTDAERAACQAILAERIKDCEERNRERRYKLEAQIAELEKENAELRAELHARKINRLVE
jgi:hypothetical protein